MRLAIRVACTQPRASSSASKPNPTSSHSESNASSPLFNTSMLSWGQLKPDPSTKCKSHKLGLKWKQYQGINHWEGLLDPLDDDLRREILRYGHFVDAAYRSFEFDPSTTYYGTCRYSKSSLLRRCGLAHTGYRLTKNLRVTCGIHVPSWIQKTLSTYWTSSCTTPPSSSWIGFVAVCEQQKEINRLGRRDVVIAFRGTATCLEWLENLRATLTYLPDHDHAEENCPMVQRGFLSLYTSKSKAATHASLQEMVREEIGRIMQSYHNEPLSLTLTGHSLGAALAILSAYDITATFKNAPMVTVVSFGGPRVGNKSFQKQLEQSGTRILRIVNSDDVVTRVPGFVLNNIDDVEGDVLGWLQRRVEDTQLVYADVGQELRLSSKESLYLKSGDIAACHDLKTYLELVKGFVSSSCSYRQKKNQNIRPEAWL